MEWASSVASKLGFPSLNQMQRKAVGEGPPKEVFFQSAGTNKYCHNILF